MEAILPLKISGDWSEHDLQRAAMLVFSLDAFWKSEEPLKLHIIAKTEELQTIRRAFSAERVTIDVVDENDLVPSMRKYPEVNGWYKQQALKLAAHKLVSAEKMLILDADIFCCRPFSKDSFVDDGKLLADWEPRTAQKAWWEASARILEMEPRIDADGIKPTPEILLKSVCAELEDFLAAKQGDAWGCLLGDLGWSEFTLYNLFCDKSGRTEILYHPRSWMNVYNKGLRTHDCFSSREQFDRWTPRRSLKTSPYGHFMVCNSSTHIDPREIWRKMAPHVEGTPRLFGEKWPGTDDPPSPRTKGQSGATADGAQKHSVSNFARSSEAMNLTISDQIAQFERDFEPSHDFGSLSMKTIRAFERLAPQPFRQTMETGCGKSTILFSNISENHLVFCLDDRERTRSSVNYFQKCPITKNERLTLFFGPTQKTLPSHAFDGLLDCALIDGPHGYPFPDLEYYFIYQNLRSGGYLIVDDVHIPTIASLFHILREDEMFELVELVGEKTAIFRRTTAPLFNPLGDGWWEQRYNRHRVPIDSPYFLPSENKIVETARATMTPANTVKHALELASHLKAQGRESESLPYYVWAAELEPDNGEAQFQLAIALDRNGQQDRALVPAREAARLAQDRPSVWRLYSRLALLAGRLDEAATAARHVVAIAPDLGPGWFELAEALAQTGELDEALAAANKALSFDGENAAFHCRLAQILEQRQDLDGARREFVLAADLAPTNHWYAFLLSEFLERIGDFGQSLVYAEHANQLRPAENIEIRIAMLKQRIQKAERAGAWRAAAPPPRGADKKSFE